MALQHGFLLLLLLLVVHGVQSSDPAHASGIPVKKPWPPARYVIVSGTIKCAGCFRNISSEPISLARVTLTCGKETVSIYSNKEGNFKLLLHLLDNSPTCNLNVVRDSLPPACRDGLYPPDGITLVLSPHSHVNYRYWNFVQKPSCVRKEQQEPRAPPPEPHSKDSRGGTGRHHRRHSPETPDITLPLAPPPPPLLADYEEPSPDYVIPDYTLNSPPKAPFLPPPDDDGLPPGVSPPLSS